MSASSRQYDLVVLGATGYTGKLTSEFITTNLPADLHWAIAGRSVNKLESVSAECKTLNPQGSHPGKFRFSRDPMQVNLSNRMYLVFFCDTVVLEISPG
jgi:hypothetical protein